MIDTRRKLLIEALGEKWIETLQIYPQNRTFTSAKDYEALREKVIVPHKQAFLSFLYRSCGYRRDKVIAVYESLLRWWLGLSPEECCEAICEFGIIELGWAIIEQEGNNELL